MAYSLFTLSLPHLKDLQGLLSSLNSTHDHGTKRWAHTIRAIELTQLHAAHGQAGDNLTRSLGDGILGAAHVESAHAADFRDRIHADEALGAEGTKGAVVAGGGDHEGCVDVLRITKVSSWNIQTDC